MTIRNFLFRVGRGLERRGAWLQGKGFGYATIDQQVQAVLEVLDGPLTLAVDIGANVGEYAAALKRAKPPVEIHAFEPAALNLEKLRENFAGDPNVVIVPKAISDTSGSAVLFSDKPGSRLGSLTKRDLDHLNRTFDEQERVETITFLDYWRGALGGRTVDVVKLDIEGHELFALQGFGEALAHIRPVQFEFGGTNIDTRTYLHDFWLFFRTNDFTLHRITPFGAELVSVYRESDETFTTTNFIAVRNRR